MPTALRRADVQDAAHDPWGRRIGIALVIAVGSPDITPRGMIAQGTAPRRGAHPCQHTALHEGECCVAPHTTPPYQSASVVVCRIIAASGIGQPCPKDRPACEP